MQIAIIGCGWAGRRHASALRRSGAVVRWAVDLDPQRAIAINAEKYSTDYRVVFDDPHVEGVAICLPHYLHHPVAIEAARARKHILCEKPLAVSLEQADQMIEAAGQAGVLLMVAENVRYNRLYQRVQVLLREGVIGQPSLVQVSREAYLRESFLKERRWFLDAHAAAGGIMMSGGIHDFELMRMLIGEVKTVYARHARQRFIEMEGDDTSQALVTFTNGTIGTLTESFLMKSLITASGPEIHTLRIDGDLGSLSVPDGQTILLFSERPDLCPAGELQQHYIHLQPGDTFSAIATHFLECVYTGRESLTSGRSQRQALKLVLAAYESMATALPVYV